jgi:hypothetical protein
LTLVHRDGRGFSHLPLLLPRGSEEFDVILGRIEAAGIKYPAVRGPTDMEVNTQLGGRIVYWNEPEGHQWRC